jgi:hypothetical protein
LRRLPLTLLAVLATATPAQAAHPDLWATVNRCDTPASPDAMGVRASMPGNGTRQRMYMRFNASWYDRSREAWFPVQGVRHSGWIHVGSARFRARQSGWTFQFAPPAAGSDFVVRGVVEFQWRKRRRRGGGRGSREIVVDQARANTRHGIRSVPAGDPPGTSEGLCVIRA